MITNSGRHIQIAGRRYCAKCQCVGDHVCHKIRYEDNPQQEGTMIKKSYWICSRCLTEVEEVKVQPLPSDKVRIISRVLKMQADYAISSMKIASLPEKLLIEITVEE